MGRRCARWGVRRLLVPLRRSRSCSKVDSIYWTGSSAYDSKYTDTSRMMTERAPKKRCWPDPRCDAVCCVQASGGRPNRKDYTHC